MTGDELLKQLNPEQAKAAGTIDGPVLVLAGAGTGKTRVITYRIAYMLASGVPPESILGMTFTNKAAREMAERLTGLVGAELAKRVTLGTFHSFCLRVLKRDIGKLGYLTTFSIADETDQQGLYKQAMATLGWSKEDTPLSPMIAKIGQWKNQLMTVADARQNAVTDFDANCAALYRVYQNSLELQNMVDFDDMLLLTYRLFNEFPEILAKYQAHYCYLLVDEYQDTNDAQFAIVKALTGKKQNLCVVGDDDQSIYSWRGANINNILDFPKLFTGTTQVKLEQNYRSTTTILAAANAVISNNSSRHDKKLWSNLGTGEHICVIEAPNGHDEAEFIAQMVQQLRRDDPTLKYKDVAVLYRSNHLSRELEGAFRSFQVPYRMVGGQEFFNRKEVKDAVAYLKLLANPRDNQSLLRILAAPPRGLADKTVTVLKNLYDQSKTPMVQLLSGAEFKQQITGKGATGAAELAAAIAAAKTEFSTPGNLAGKAGSYLREVGYLTGLQRMYKDFDDAQKRRENVDEFLSAMAQYESNQAAPPALEDFLDSFALSEENDRSSGSDENADAVTFSTIHAAKGLEFPVVFLVAMEQDAFPHERAVEEGSTAEELRLFYVAITRARKRLILSCARERFARGKREFRLNSPFLQLLPPELTDCHEPDDLLKPLTQAESEAAWAQLFALLEK